MDTAQQEEFKRYTLDRWYITREGNSDLILVRKGSRQRHFSMSGYDTAVWLISDIEKYMNSEEKYGSRSLPGRPWQRGNYD